MFSRIATKPAKQLVSKRLFSSSSRQFAPHFEDGVYTNIPFKVHNRRVPYAVPHFLFFAVGMGLPFFAAYVQLKRSGSL